MSTIGVEWMRAIVVQLDQSSIGLSIRREGRIQRRGFFPAYSA
jgi:hypothetical protein